jgi:hypothetical protein
LKFNITDAMPRLGLNFAFSLPKGEQQGFRGAATCHETWSVFAKETIRGLPRYESRQIR